MSHEMEGARREAADLASNPQPLAQPMAQP
jgi:hypothetical protein